MGRLKNYSMTRNANILAYKLCGSALCLFGFLTSAFALWHTSNGNDIGGPMNFQLASLINIPLFIIGIVSVNLSVKVLDIYPPKMHLALSSCLLSVAIWNVFWLPPIQDGVFHMLRGINFYDASIAPSSAWEHGLVFGVASYFLYLALPPKKDTLLIHQPSQKLFLLLHVVLPVALIFATGWSLSRSVDLIVAGNQAMSQQIFYISFLTLVSIALSVARMFFFKTTQILSLLLVYSWLNVLLFIFMVLIYGSV